jgi:hypothetical protein
MRDDLRFAPLRCQLPRVSRGTRGVLLGFERSHAKRVCPFAWRSRCTRRGLTRSDHQATDEAEQQDRSPRHHTRLAGCSGHVRAWNDSSLAICASVCDGGLQVQIGE